MARVMAMKQLAIESLEEQLLRKDIEKEGLMLQVKVKADALTLAELAVVACRDAHKQCEKRAKTAKKEGSGFTKKG